MGLGVSEWVSVGVGGCGWVCLDLPSSGPVSASVLQIHAAAPAEAPPGPASPLSSQVRLPSTSSFPLPPPSLHLSSGGLHPQDAPPILSPSNRLQCFQGLQWTRWKDRARPLRAYLAQ